MATAQSFIEAALRKIGIKGSDTELDDSELSDGLEALNDMGYQLEAEGYDLDFSEISSVTDTMTTPSYANEFIKCQLAIRLSADYPEAVLSTGLTEAASAAKRVAIRYQNRKSVGTSGTYQNLIFGAFELSGVKDGSEPISSVEIDNAIPRLNDLMTELESRGFAMSYTINTSGDMTLEHGIPDWANSWIKAELAIRLSYSYTVEPNMVCMQMASNGEAAAYLRLGNSVTTNYPSTLPMGSGCHGYDHGFDSITNGTGGSISTGDGYELEYK